MTLDKNQRARMLRESWPLLFAQEPLKPMKTGIMQDLIADAEKRQIDFPGLEIGKALKRYTRTIPYQLALANDHSDTVFTASLTESSRRSSGRWRSPG